MVVKIRSVPNEHNICLSAYPPLLLDLVEGALKPVSAMSSFIENNKNNHLLSSYRAAESLGL
jgi:hypothetical protein